MIFVKNKSRLLTGVMSSLMLLSAVGSIASGSNYTKREKIRDGISIETQFNELSVIPSDEKFVINGQIFEFGTGGKYITWCEYDYQADEVVLKYCYQVGEYRSFSEVIEKHNTDYYFVEQDSYSMYGAEALSQTFFIVSDNQLSESELSSVFTSNNCTITKANTLGTYIELEQDEYYNFAAYYELADGTLPSLNGSNNIYLSNVDNPVDIEYIQSLLIATDETDGDITNKIELVEDNYTGNESELGVHYCIFKVSDNAGNIAYTEVGVAVCDITDPVISGKTSYSIQQGTELTLDDIKDGLEVSDNCDTTLTSSKLSVVEDTYTGHENELGTYKVVLQAKDKSGNITEQEVSITINDGVAPVISGADKIITSLSLEKSLSSLLTGYSAVDETDGDIELNVVEDGYTGHEDEVGTYSVKVSATDGSGNMAEKTITIEVKDDIPPIFTSDMVITIDYYNSLTHEQIVGFITERDVASFSVLVDEYSGNESKVGRYKVKYEVEYEDGSIEIIEQEINVVNHDPWYVNAWNGIKNFFVETIPSWWDLFIEKVWNPFINLFKSKE